MPFYQLRTKINQTHSSMISFIIFDIKKLFFFFFFFLLFSTNSISQEQIKGLPFIKNFTPQEYGEHIQNWSIIQDQRGIMYIGNVNGIMEYDGETFRLIKLPGQATGRSMAIDENNRVYVGTVGDMGYLRPDKTGQTRFVSLAHKLDTNHRHFADVWDTRIVGDAVLFRTYQKLFRYSQDTFTVWEAKQRFTGGFTINDTYFIRDESQGLLKIKDDSLVPAPYGDLFLKKYINHGLEFSKEKALFPSSDKLYLYHPSAQSEEKAITRFPTDSDKYIKQGNIYISHKTRGNKIIIGTLSNRGVVIIDSTGNTIRKINRELGLQKGSIYNITTDREGNAWLAMSNGLSKADISSSITFWDERLGLEGTVEDLITFNNTLYIATHQGFYYMDNEGKIHEIRGFKSQCWDFLKFRDPNNPEKVRLLATGRDNIFEIKNNKLHTLWRIKDESYAFYLHQSEDHPDLLYAGIANGLTAIRYQDGAFVKEYRIMERYRNIRSISEDNRGNMWLGLFRKGAVRVTLKDNGTQAESIKLYDEDDGFRSTKNILVYPFNNRLIFASNKGFHRFNYKKDRFVPDSTLGVSFGDGSRDVFSFKEMEDGTVWCSGLNNKTGKIGRGTPNEKGGYSWEYRKFNRIPRMLVLALYIQEDGTAWIGGSEGLFRYTPDKKKHKEPFNTVIRKVTIGKDSLIFGGNSSKTLNGDTFAIFQSEVKHDDYIPYKFNTIDFQFSALSYKDIKENKYSFYLEGYQDKWLDWTDKSFKQYTNLREGDYVFHVKSRNIYGTVGKQMQFRFTIAPPWYRTTLAYIGYVLLFGILLYLGIILNTRRLKEKNKKLEEIIQARTQEIREQKEEIEQQKEEIEQQRDSISNQADQLKLINKELRKLTIVARETDNAVIITDPDGNIEWINEGFVRLFGYNIEELREKFGMNIIEGSSVKNMREIFQKVKTNQSSETYESKVVAKNGEVINAYTTLTPVLDNNGEVEKMIAIDSDIRELKNAEEELKRLNATKDKFFSIIAHDLKNPFGSLLGASDVLLKKFDKFDREKILQFITNIRQVAKQGYDLLLNLLEWSRAQTGRLKFEMQNLNLNELVKANIDLLQTAANNKKIEIINAVDPEITVFADRNTTLTVLRNLISNAIKYTHIGGKVNIFSETVNDHIKIIVEDEGIGIPEDVQKKLFRIDESYSQKGTNDESGTGLGLILCKEFVEKNKGQIWVESEEDKGSKFIFTLLKG